MKGKHQPWPMMKVGALFDVQLGKMLNQKARTGELRPYLANFNVRWGAFDLTRLNQMSFSEQERKKFSLESGDLVMCEGGEIGRCAVWRRGGREIFYQKALHRLRPKNKNANSYFYYYYMQHVAEKGELPKLVGESSIAHLTREKLLDLKVPTPSHHEQTAIANLLSTWDEAIEKTERLIASKRRSSAWLIESQISQYCTTESCHWPKKLLGEIFEERSETHHVDLPLLSITREEGIIPFEGSGRKDNSNDDKSKYLRVCPGDIAYNTMRMWQGVSALSKYEGIVSPAYTVCIPSDALDGEFMAHYFKTPWMIHQFYRYSQGLTSDTWNLKFKHFREIKAPIPPLDEQRRIAGILNTARAETALLERRVNLLRSQKRGLMQKLLAGTWRVKSGVEAA